MRNTPASQWIVIGLIALSFPFLGYGVHVCLIKYCYLWHARRFCRKNKLELLTRVKSLLRVRHMKSELERALTYLNEIEHDEETL